MAIGQFWFWANLLIALAILQFATMFFANTAFGRALAFLTQGVSG